MPMPMLKHLWNNTLAMLEFSGMKEYALARHQQLVRWITAEAQISANSCRGCYLEVHAVRILGRLAPRLPAVVHRREGLRALRRKEPVGHILRNSPMMARVPTIGDSGQTMLGHKCVSAWLEPGRRCRKRCTQTPQ